MDNITIKTKEALINYFNHLSNFGYRNYTSVYRLLVISFLEELLDGQYKCIITEDNLRDIMRALDCLYNNECLIPKYSNSKGYISTVC